MRRGVTLIEVMCGIALMGTLLTGLVVASSAHLRQMHRADLRVRAAAQLDNWLIAWSDGQAKLPTQAPVRIQYETGWLCRAEARQARDLTPRGFGIVRVSMSREVSPQDQLVSVDLLVPLEPMSETRSGP